MKRAGNFPKCVRFGMAMVVAFAPMATMAAEPPPPTAADFVKLQREVAEQRALIIQMMQVEQQRYDMLLKLLQSGGQLSPATPLPPQSGQGSSSTRPVPRQVRQMFSAVWEAPGDASSPGAISSTTSTATSSSCAMAQAVPPHSIDNRS